MTIFREHDKYMDARWASEVDAANAGDHNLDADAADWIRAPPEAYEGAPVWKEYAEDIEDGDMSTAFGYAATVETVVKRLSLMGVHFAARCKAEMAELLRELRLLARVLI
ncbi:hypothetical protein [Kitasatospora sp. NPDC059673]|uniref:hypothetical protein n=1 Tax=Kitasatospora sp. NPDC059673 TaxID=3346901 RepID=UPI0036BD7373